MPHSLCADEFVGELLNIARPATQDHHLKARFVIEMGMERRDHHFVMFMLKVGKFFGQKPGVMVIDQSDGSNHWSPRGNDCSPNKLIAHQIAKRLGSVVVAFFSDELVKAIE